MNIELTGAIAGYFAADRDRDAEAICRHFTDGAVVEDEGKLHRGRAAIQSWMSEAWQKYNCANQPFEATYNERSTVVTSHVTGDFPGSPIDLRYHFELEGDLIARLKVTL